MERTNRRAELVAAANMASEMAAHYTRMQSDASDWFHRIEREITIAKGIGDHANAAAARVKYHARAAEADLFGKLAAEYRAKAAILMADATIADKPADGVHEGFLLERTRPSGDRAYWNGREWRDASFGDAHVYGTYGRARIGYAFATGERGIDHGVLAIVKFSEARPGDRPTYTRYKAVCNVAGDWQGYFHAVETGLDRL